MSWTGAILYKGGCHFSSFVCEGSGSSFMEVDDFVCTDGFGSRRVWPQLRSDNVKNMHVLVYKLAGPAEGGAAVPPVRVSSPAATSGSAAAAGSSDMGSTAAEVEDAPIDHGAESSVDPEIDAASMDAASIRVSESMESARPIEPAASASGSVPPSAAQAGSEPTAVVCVDCLIREVTDQGTLVSEVTLDQLKTCFSKHERLGTVPYRTQQHTRKFCPRRNPGADLQCTRKLGKLLSQWLQRRKARE